MGLRARILRAVSPLPIGAGPATRATLHGMFKVEHKRVDDLIAHLIEQGELVMLGGKRGTRYGLPRKRGRA